MENDPVDVSGLLIAEHLRGRAVRHVELLERRHYVASCWHSLQDRLAQLEEGQRQLVRDSVESAAETAIE